MNNKFSFDNLALDDYDCSPWFEEWDDVPAMMLLENDDEVKEGEEFKILSSTKTINQTFNIISTNKSWK